MESGIVTRYNASAGSGKTFKLAGVYLDHLFESPTNYRNILAVTFTNKAAAEMKERILNSLYELSVNIPSGHLNRLVKLTGKTEERIRSEAGRILRNILHDYSGFSVGTIDSFFQKILRSFARESGLHAGYNLVLDHSVVLSEAVDDVISGVENNSEMLSWLIRFSKHEISEGNSWNLKAKIGELGQEIFKEEFRLLTEQGRIIDEKSSLTDRLNDLYIFNRSFKNKLSEMASSALGILEKHGVDQDSLLGKSNSIKKFLGLSLNSVPEKIGNSMTIATEEKRYHSPKGDRTAVDMALADGLGEIIGEITHYYNSNITIYKSIRLVLSNIYTLGILNDISFRIRELLSSSNKFLLSDAGDLLRQIIGKDQTPFIYEKIGNRYNNFMIDEFQDTSLIQWENFHPLILNSISEGEHNLVVGDIKQAIYRWRNSDWTIFNGLHNQFHNESFGNETLDDNWRSAPNIIAFNNALFSTLPGLIEENPEIGGNVISDLYEGVRQNDPGRFSDGYIRMKQIVATDENHQNDIMLDEIPLLIEEIQDNGYSAGDIGILVRVNSEGQKIIDRLMRYAAEADGIKRKRYSYQVISQDSLFLKNSAAVKFIISTLQFMVDNNDKLAFSSMIHNYLATTGKSGGETRPYLLHSELPGDIGFLPAGYTEFLTKIIYFPLFDIVDRLIDFFDISSVKSAVPYITTLQDLILELSGKETNDIPVFLEWWENEGQKKSVSSSEQSDSIQLMTIHKSKGLQFKVVIVPFVNWGLDHGMKPVMWVYNDHEPFNNLGAMPVKYKKEIAETVFEDFYYRERTNVAIDRLNLLYVAFTRAEECLYGFIPTGKRKSDNIGAKIIDLFTCDHNSTESSVIFNQWDSEKMMFSFGQIPSTHPPRRTGNPENDLIITYRVSINDSRLRLKLHSKDYTDNENREKKINYGLVMHDIFSSINTPDDIEPSFDRAVKEGIISISERNYLIPEMKKMISKKPVAEWFTEDADVKSEADILLPGGDVRRPDRVIFYDNRVVVVDFKFGKENASHLNQVRLYMKLLNEMGYKSVDGYLWYVDRDKVVKLD